MGSWYGRRENGVREAGGCHPPAPPPPPPHGIGSPVKVKVIHGFLKLLFYALPTGNLLHYISGRNDVLHVSPIK